MSGKVLGVYTEDVNVGPDAELPAAAATETLDSFLRKLVGGHSGNRANCLLWMFLWGSGGIATGGQHTKPQNPSLNSSTTASGMARRSGSSTY